MTRPPTQKTDRQLSTQFGDGSVLALLTSTLKGEHASPLLLAQNIRCCTDWKAFRPMLQALEDSGTHYIALVFTPLALPCDLQETFNCSIQALEQDFEGSLNTAVNEASHSGNSTLLWITQKSEADLANQSIGEASDEFTHITTPEKLSQAPFSHVTSVIAREDRKAIWNKSFSPEVRRWIATYDQVGARDLYLWQWCLHGIEMTTFPSVDAEFFQDLCDTKLLSVILCVLFDDVADQPGNEQWLDDLIQSVRNPRHTIQDREHQEHIQVTSDLWHEYESRVRSLPHYHQLQRVWDFDIEQFLTAMTYGQLMNQMPELANSTEQDVYTPHNMLMVSFGTLDLMCSNGIPRDEYGLIREALWHAQAMGRVGNVLSTWRRELNERDCSNGIVAKALADGILTREDLLTADVNDLRQTLVQAGYQDDFMEKWNRHRRICHRSAEKVKSIDLKSTLDAHDRFLEMHLGSVGLI